MKHQHYQWVFIGAVAVVFVLIGVMIERQLEIDHLRNTPRMQPVVSGAMRQLDSDDRFSASLAPTADRTQAIGVEEVAAIALDPGYNHVKYPVRFVHRCVNGRIVRLTPDTPGREGGNFTSYCLGKNQLVVEQNGQTDIVEEKGIQDPAQAPVLLGAQLTGDGTVSSDEVLISYAPEPCGTVNDCGVGMPTSFVSYVFNFVTHQTRPLFHYPNMVSDKGKWNKSLTKIVFTPTECGGAGCFSEPLLGYNLRTDQVVEHATNQEAAAFMPGRTESPTDVSGKPLPYWSSLPRWTSDSSFETSYVDLQGKAHKVTGQF